MEFEEPDRSEEGIAVVRRREHRGDLLGHVSSAGRLVDRRRRVSRQGRLGVDPVVSQSIGVLRDVLEAEEVRFVAGLGQIHRKEPFVGIDLPVRVSEPEHPVLVRMATGHET